MLGLKLNPVSKRGHWRSLWSLAIVPLSQLGIGADNGIMLRCRQQLKIEIEISVQTEAVTGSAAMLGPNVTCKIER